MDYLPEAKSARLLAMYARLLSGEALHRTALAMEYGVTVRSIQRDIETLRCFLAEQRLPQDVVYDRRERTYKLVDNVPKGLSNSEILAVCKILLESRAFPKPELSAILDKLISGCVPQSNMKLVSDLLANEKFHYVELTHPSPIQDQLWNIGSAIQQRTLMELEYQRQGQTASPVTRVVEPVSILFSEYYFYLNAYIVELDERRCYIHKYDYPAIFRMDRIQGYRTLPQRFHLPYANRFQEGEFRKRIQFMYPGRLQRIRFCYTGASVDAVLDRLPTAKIIHQDEGRAILEAEVYGKGILMWLLSQGDRVEVLEPQSMRREMEQTLAHVLALYQKA